MHPWVSREISTSSVHPYRVRTCFDALFPNNPICQRRQIKFLAEIVCFISLTTSVIWLPTVLVKGSTFTEILLNLVEAMKGCMVATVVNMNDGCNLPSYCHKWTPEGMRSLFFLDFQKFRKRGVIFTQSGPHIWPQYYVQFADIKSIGQDIRVNTGSVSCWWFHIPRVPIFSVTVITRWADLYLTKPSFREQCLYATPLSLSLDLHLEDNQRSTIDGIMDDCMLKQSVFCLRCHQSTLNTEVTVLYIIPRMASLLLLLANILGTIFLVSFPCFRSFEICILAHWA